MNTKVKMSKLTDSQKALLNKILRYRKCDEITIRAIDNVNVIQAEQILEYLVDEFSEKGLGKNREPNSYGLEIDELITYFSNRLIRLR